MSDLIAVIKCFFLWPLSRIKKSDIGNEKLVMTLLVKNEVDVIRFNLDFHLSQGVDFIIATDNMSDDGTFEILQEYEKKGFLYLIREPSHTYDQAKWVNRMGDLAFSKFNANLIFHCDGDEFWSAPGSLKDELSAYPLVDVFSVKYINVMLKNKGGEESFPEDTCYVVTNPLPDSKKKGMNEISQLLYQPQTKVMCRISKKYISVNMGNHDVRNGWSHLHRNLTDVVVYHFPIRSKKQFFQKVSVGGSALVRNKGIPQNQGSHLREWYDAYQKGELDCEYEKLLLTSDAGEKWVERGVVEVDNALSFKLNLK